jgi:NAD(P)H-dependent flavin oxidoreductase YrpB (nitropropane dioxygenase family)
MSATLAMPFPMIIQGGMGIGISDWKLARAVSQRGQLGVVSGTCIDTLFVRRLQDGDIGGHLRRAMAAFPIPEVSAEALRKYFQPGGRAPGTPYRLLSLWSQTVSRAREQLTMLASFVEVFLAKEGHDGPVGINLLTKVQLPNLATLYGAMLAGVDCVLMGAGIPKEIPGVLDALAAQEPAAVRFDVEGQVRGEEVELRFDPRAHWEATPAPLKRPAFFPIIASDSLATMLARKANGRIDGFVVEGPTAGGHNAPPRGRLEVNGRGEPVYGERDEVDLAVLRRLGLPFWVAGGAGSPAALEAALEAGAAGVQVGTLFACAEESGLDPGLRRRLIADVCAGRADVLNDLRASPTGFPFKVVQLENTNSEPERYLQRHRICDLGYLRTPYRREDGRIGFRCPAEPTDAYVKKGGALEETRGRKCMCNALMADVGHAQLREDGPELPLVTAGDCLEDLHVFLDGREAYSAGEAIDWLLSGVAAAAC